MPTRSALLLFALLLVFRPAAASGQSSPTADGATSDTTWTARITYAVGSSVYIDAGREMGLAEGDTLTVERGGKNVAMVRVTYLSSRRASCAVLTPEAVLQVRDTVKYAVGRKLASVEAPSLPTAPPDTPPSSLSLGESLRRWGIRGRLGLRYLAVNDRDKLGSDFSQPAADIYLEGKAMGGSTLGFVIDLRNRHTTYNRPDGTQDTEDRTRVYRLNTSWEASPTFRLTAGRQSSPSLAAVSTFDGGLLEFSRKSLRLGAFLGTQPDDANYGYSTDILEYGAFGALRGESTAPLRWSGVLGTIHSTENGNTNRDYAFLQGQVEHRLVSGFLGQEVDLVRGWAGDVQGAHLSLTSTYLSARYRPVPKIEVNTSFDSRRRVRLYRDRATPESEFDDSRREGVSLGVTLRPERRLLVDAGYRTSRGVSAGNADSYTLRLRATSLTSLGLHATWRETRYTGPTADGWLHALAVGGTVLSRAELELSGGLRAEDRLLPVPTPVHTNWYRLDLDLELVRQVYLLDSLESTQGDAEKVLSSYTSLTYRF